MDSLQKFLFLRMVSAACGSSFKMYLFEITELKQVEEQVHRISQYSGHRSSYKVYVLPLSRKNTKQKTESSHDT